MLKCFGASLRSAFLLTLIFTILLGGVYPLVTTAIVTPIFSKEAAGSLIEKNGKIIGSHLLGQSFDSPGYFWSRLSATTPPYNAASSSGSNLSPANPKLLDSANVRLAALGHADPANKKRIPADLLTASASGLDPHISLAAAQYQISRVARARHMKESDLEALIKKYSHAPFLGWFGEAYVNVLDLNLALDTSASK